jgi:hypothetical protein
MVVKVTRKRVCDICESDDGVCRYRITKLEGTTQRTVTSDLCLEHAEGVQIAMDAAPQPRRGRKSARPVVSLDDINAKKTAAKRAARKPATKRSQASKSR